MTAPLSRALPRAIQEQIERMREYSYGVNKVIVTLAHGRTFEHVLIGWASDVLRVGTDADISFDAGDVVAVKHQPGGRTRRPVRHLTRR